MVSVSNNQPIIIRTERGLTISGTRITLYDVMDYLTAQYPAKFIRSLFDLTDDQNPTLRQIVQKSKQNIKLF